MAQRTQLDDANNPLHEAYALAFIGCAWLWVNRPGAAIALATGLVLALGVIAWHLYWPIVLLWRRR
jgi:hypothetical protein